MIFHVLLHRPLTIIQLILQRTLLLKLYIALGMTCLEAISLFMKQYGSSKCHFSKKNHAVVHRLKSFEIAIKALDY